MAAYEKMKKTILYFLPFIIFLIVGIFLWRGLSMNPSKVPSALINKPLPDFELPLLTNEKIKITSAIFAGKITLVNVWASWCAVCEEEHSVLVELSENSHLQLVGLDYKDEPAKAREYLTEHGNPYHIVIQDRTGQVAMNWGVYGTPETFIIDKHGIIRYKLVGSLSEKGAKETILMWMEKLDHE